MRLAALAFSSLLLAAPIAAQRPDLDGKLDRLLAGRVAGPARACVPNRPDLRTEVIPGEALVYRLGGRLWVNRPSGDLARPDDTSILAQLTPVSSFCRGDLVQLFDRVGGFQRGFVNLGDFVEYRRAR